MSYDLFFYKRKESEITTDHIKSYLDSIQYSKQNDGRWIIENPDTETYFSFDFNEPENEVPEPNEDPYLSEGFVYSNLSFNLNYMRPDFFGLYAFPILEKLITDLDLYVLNPQQAADPDLPAKPGSGELYKNWSGQNQKWSVDLIEPDKYYYMPAEKANEVYNYNLAIKELQGRLKNSHFVPKLFFFRQKDSNRCISICTWAHHYPTVLPVCDYYYIGKKYKRFFKTVQESGVVKCETLFSEFSSLIEDFEPCHGKIIHPEQAKAAQKLFNSIKFEFKADFAERIPVEQVTHIKKE